MIFNTIKWILILLMCLIMTKTTRTMSNNSTNTSTNNSTINSTINNTIILGNILNHNDILFNNITYINKYNSYINNFNNHNKQIIKIDNNKDNKNHFISEINIKNNNNVNHIKNNKGKRRKNRTTLKHRKLNKFLRINKHRNKLQRKLRNIRRHRKNIYDNDKFIRDKDVINTISRDKNVINTISRDVLYLSDGDDGDDGRNVVPSNKRLYQYNKFQDYQIEQDVMEDQDDLFSLTNITRRQKTLLEQHGRRRSPPQPYKSLQTTEPKVKKVIVRVHNLLRAKVIPTAADMLAMTWHSTAASQAQSWAEECQVKVKFDHPITRWSPRYGVCGQTVYVTAKKKRWGEVIKGWWSRRRTFRYGVGKGNITRIGSYTQLAWYNSHKVGCGFAQCSSDTNKIFYRYVCNYCPAGNDPSRLTRPYKRGEPCGQCPNSCRSVCRRGKCFLCTNSCAFSDLWVNCAGLSKHWHEWLCSTKTVQGIIRFKNCRATCQCRDKIT